MKTENLITTAAILALVAVAPSLSAKTLTSHVERSFPAEPGGRVSVDVSFHDVEVKVAAVDEVTFVVDLEVRASSAKAERLLAELEPRFSERGGTISMKSTRNGGWSSGLFGGPEAEGRVRLTLPPGLDLELDTASGDCEVEGDLGSGRLRVDVASGDVFVRGAAAEIVVDTASGDAELVLSREVPAVNVDVASGDVIVKGAAHQLRVDAASGDIEASGLVGPASFDTASGSIKARWASITAGDRVVADTASGDVRLAFPGAVRMGGRLTTNSGEITTTFPGRLGEDEDSYRFDGDGDAVRVHVDTASGDIVVVGD